MLLVVPYDGSVRDRQGVWQRRSPAKTLVIDVSNPIARRDGEELVKQVNDEGGAGLATQKALPGAHLVRGFNAIGSGQLADLRAPRREIRSLCRSPATTRTRWRWPSA